MNRVIVSALIGATLLGATAAVAAGTSPTTAPRQPVATSPTNTCGTLPQQWKTAAAANPTNPNLASATTLANKAATECVNPDVRVATQGANDYKSALTLLGVTPH